MGDGNGMRIYHKASGAAPEVVRTDENVAGSFLAYLKHPGGHDMAKHQLPDYLSLAKFLLEQPDAWLRMEPDGELVQGGMVIELDG